MEYTYSFTCLGIIIIDTILSIYHRESVIQLQFISYIVFNTIIMILYEIMCHIHEMIFTVY